MGQIGLNFSDFAARAVKVGRSPHSRSLTRPSRTLGNTMAALWDKITGKGKDERSPAERHVRSFDGGNLADVAREEVYAVPRPSVNENPALKGMLRSDSTLRNIVESDLRTKKREQEKKRMLNYCLHTYR